MKFIGDIAFHRYNISVSGPKRFGYIKKSLYRELNQYYAKSRYYNPTTLRWLSCDPLSMVEGPNVYAYVRGNVVNAVDPDGRFVVTSIIQTILDAALILCERHKNFTECDKATCKMVAQCYGAFMKFAGTVADSIGCLVGCTPWVIAGGVGGIACVGLCICLVIGDAINTADAGAKCMDEIHNRKCACI